jgi:hypothetical protein
MSEERRTRRKSRPRPQRRTLTFHLSSGLYPQHHGSLVIQRQPSLDRGILVAQTVNISSHPRQACVRASTCCSLAALAGLEALPFEIDYCLCALLLPGVYFWAKLSLPSTSLAVSHYHHGAIQASSHPGRPISVPCNPVSSIGDCTSLPPNHARPL